MSTNHGYQRLIEPNRFTEPKGWDRFVRKESRLGTVWELPHSKQEGHEVQKPSKEWSDPTEWKWKDYDHYMIHRWSYPDRPQIESRLIISYIWHVTPEMLKTEQHPKTMTDQNAGHEWADMDAHYTHPKNEQFYKKAVLPRVKESWKRSHEDPEHETNAKEKDHINIMIFGNGSGNVLLELLTQQLKHYRSFNFTCLDIMEKNHVASKDRLRGAESSLRAAGHEVPHDFETSWDYTEKQEYHMLKLGENKFIRFYNCLMQNCRAVRRLHRQLNNLETTV